MVKLITRMDARLEKIAAIFMSVKREERTREDLIKCGCPECSYVVTLLDS